jgi:hypothetical protein
VTDDELTDAWEACQLGRAISHAEHVRISWVLISRHGRAAGSSRIATGTAKNCKAMNAAERFDPELTARWTEAIAVAAEAGDAPTAERFLEDHPEFLNSQLFGVPAWARNAQVP